MHLSVVYERNRQIFYNIIRLDLDGFRLVKDSDHSLMMSVIYSILLVTDILMELSNPFSSPNQLLICSPISREKGHHTCAFAHYMHLPVLCVCFVSVSLSPTHSNGVYCHSMQNCCMITDNNCTCSLLFMDLSSCIPRWPSCSSISDKAWRSRCTCKNGDVPTVLFWLKSCQPITC